jgi:hypothetical protein
LSKTIFTFTEEFDDAGHLIKRTITTEQGETVLPVTPNTKPIDNMPFIPTPTPRKAPLDIIWKAPPDITCNSTGGTVHES